MTTAIIVNNGQVLTMRVDNAYSDKNTDRMDLYVQGAVISVSSNNALVLHQNEMDDSSYNQMIKTISSALVSDEGTISYYNPEAKTVSKNKRLIK